MVWRRGVGGTPCVHLVLPLIVGVLVVNLLSCTRKDSRLVYSRDNTRKKETEMSTTCTIANVSVHTFPHKSFLSCFSPNKLPLPT